MKERPTAAGSQVPDQPVQVGIGLVSRDGMYLVRQRPPGGPMPGYWEFPGGKCEPGESPRDATVRECREELGVDVQVNRLRRVVNFRYPHAWVEMSFFDCETSEPRAEPLPSTGFCWIPARELPNLRFPGANDEVIEELVRGSVPSPAHPLGVGGCQ